MLGSNNSTLSPGNATLAANLSNGTTLMPTLNVVQSVMAQTFGTAPYSKVTNSIASLAGMWNIQSRMAPSSIVMVSPLAGTSGAPLVPATGVMGSTGVTTDDIVTTTGTPTLNGYLSFVSPQNYLIYTPFPSRSTGNPAYTPVGGVGLVIDPNTISMVNFPYATQSIWTRTQGYNPQNVAFSSAVSIANGALPLQVTPGSPAGVAASLGVTPVTLQNSIQGAAQANLTQTLSPQQAFAVPTWSTSPLASSMNTVNSGTLPSSFTMQQAALSNPVRTTMRRGRVNSNCNSTKFEADCYCDLCRQRG